MSTAFEKYSDILFSAFVSSTKQSEIAAKKKEILDEVLDHYNIEPAGVLFVGFSPGIELFKNSAISVTEVGTETQSYLSQFGCEYRALDSIRDKEFDVVVAVDEYLTFAASDEDQRHLIDNLARITNRCLITTLRDYKNQDFKNREFSSPIVVRGAGKRIYLEHYDYDSYDRNSCAATCYVIDDNSVDIIGPFARRNLFFKQLAKFSLDAGAENFLIHKNTMHKSIIKKNYEHIITIKF
jgi:hypothetical protein